MQNWINEEDWLVEMEIPAGPAQPDPAGGQPPASTPGTPGDPMGQNPGPVPPQGGPAPAADDISADPQYPDMPDQEEDQDNDFESWKANYAKETIKGDPVACMEMIAKIRDKDLDPHQRKFVEDNFQICALRQHQDILIPSAEIRKLAKQQLDRNNPATSMLTHVTEVLDKNPLLNTIYIKLLGCSGGKQDYHRKFLGALMGCVQVGNGKKNEDLVFEDTDYSIRLSTRFASSWGNLSVGPWTMKEDDPERFLKPAELQRLEGGSPEEKDVLKRRIVMESISNMFKQRAFIMNVVDDQGTIQHLGLDLGNCLLAAYTDGRLIVRTDDSDARDAFIDDEGSIIAIPTLKINYVKESDMNNDKGEPELEEIEFMRLDEGMLKLTATVDLIKESASTLQGVLWKETPWQGNPSDLLRVMRSVPSVPEVLLMKRV